MCTLERCATNFLPTVNYKVSNVLQSVNKSKSSDAVGAYHAGWQSQRNHAEYTSFSPASVYSKLSFCKNSTLKSYNYCSCVGRQHFQRMLQYQAWKEACSAPKKSATGQLIWVLLVWSEYQHTWPSLQFLYGSLVHSNFPFSTANFMLNHYTLWKCINE